MYTLFIRLSTCNQRLCHMKPLSVGLKVALEDRFVCMQIWTSLSYSSFVCSRVWVKLYKPYLYLDT